MVIRPRASKIAAQHRDYMSMHQSYHIRFRAHHATRIPMMRGSMWESASEIRRLVGTRAVSATEVAREFLARNHALGHLHAVVRLHEEAFLGRAAEIDARVQRGGELGDLAGVPFTVKDNITIAGYPCAAGSPALATDVAAVTAPVVSRMLCEDAMLLGQTWCPEFATAAVPQYEAEVAVINPLMQSATPGGSSAGEASIVAAGGSLIGIGTDYGGSVRWPAQCTGVAALRPTVDPLWTEGQIPGACGRRPSRGPCMPNIFSPQGQFQTVGPLARSVADLATMFRAVAGRRRGGTPVASDPSCAPVALRVAWCASDGIVAPRRDVRAALDHVLSALSDRGHRIDEELPFLSNGAELFSRVRENDPLEDLRKLVDDIQAVPTPRNRTLISAAERTAPADLAEAWAEAAVWRKSLYAVVERFDVLVAPVSPAPATDRSGRSLLDGTHLTERALMSYCRAITLTALPALSVPVGTSEEGLPISVQLIGAPHAEPLLLAVGSLIELDHDVLHIGAGSEG